MAIAFLTSAIFLSIILIILFNFRALHRHNPAKAAPELLKGLVRLSGITLTAVITGVLIFPALRNSMKTSNWECFTICLILCVVCSVLSAVAFYHLGTWVLSRTSLNKP